MSIASLARIRRKEPIQVLSRRHNYFPKRFVWRGQQYDIYRVERAWTDMKGRGGRNFFRVRCPEGVFDIFQDAALNAWYLAAQVR